MWIRFLEFLGARHGEYDKVSLLLGKGFFMGVFLAAYQVGAEVLFLKTPGLGEGLLDVAFFTAGFLGIFSSVLFVYLQKKIAFSKLVLGQLTVITAFLVLIAFLFEFSSKATVGSGLYNALVFAAFVVLGPTSALILLGFWGTFNRMFDLRASKRIIGGIDTGQLTATIIAFFIIGSIPQRLYTTSDLILVSALSVTGSLIFLFLIVRRYDLTEITNKAENEEEVKEVGYLDLLKNRYLKYLSLFLILSMIASQFMEFTFLNTINIFYPDEGELKTFIAFFSAVVMIGSFIIQTFFNDIIIGTYGLRVSLLVMPAVLGLFCLGAAVTGNIFGYAEKNDELIYFFLFITLGRFSSAAFKDALESPAYKLFFLPLDIKIRFDVQTKIEGVINELSALLAGTLLVILGLEYFDFFKLIGYTYLILAVIVAMYFVTKHLYDEYRKTLSDTLERHKKKFKKQQIDHRNIIDQILEECHCNDADRVLYGLRVLEKVEPIILEHQLRSHLGHSDENVRKYCIQKLQEIGNLDSVEALEKQSNNASNGVRELVIRALNSLTEMKGYQVSEQKIKALVRSKESGDRIFAARLLTNLDEENYYPYVAELLRDINLTVRQAAIVTAGKLQKREFWEFLVENLNSPDFSNAATAAIVSIGEPILPYLEDAFNKSGSPLRTKVRIVQIYGRIGGDEAASLLWKKIDSPEREVYTQVLFSLAEMGYRAFDYQAARIKITIESDIKDAIWNLSALINIPKGEDYELLREALKEEVQSNYNRIFMLLSMNYDPESIQLVKDNVESGLSDNVTFALELLDTFVTEDLKPKLFPLLDDIPVQEKIKRLDEFFPPENFSSVRDVFRKIINRDYNSLNRWTKALALFFLGNLETQEGEDLDFIVANLYNPDYLLKQTAAWCLYLQGTDIYERETSRLPEEEKKRIDRVISPPSYLIDDMHQELLKIERIMRMKTVGIFSNLSGVVLAELEDYVDEIAPKEGSILIKEGEKGSSPMLLVIEGKLIVTKDGKHIRDLKVGELFGDDYITDSEINEYTVTAGAGSAVIRLDKNKFYELTSKNHQLVYGLFAKKSEEILI